MYTDAWKAAFERAELQGKPVLFTPNRVLHETVPEKWFRYELRGRGRDFEVPRYLEKEVAVDFAGTVLSPERFALNHGRLNIEGDFERLHEAMTVSDFCKAQHLPEPQDARKYIPRPASREENEAGVFYAMKPEQDAALGVVGHVRIDFGYQGKQFYHSWWPRGPEALNTPEFKAELGKVVDELRRGPLKSLQDMRRFCHANGGEIDGGILGQNYGYVIETERYKYLLRCNPVEGDYQAYLTAMDKRAQEMGMGQKQETEMTMTMGGM